MFIRILPLLLLAQIIQKWHLTILFVLQPICDKCQISSCRLWKWNIIQAEFCIFLYTLYMSLYIIVLCSYKYIIFYIIIFLILYILHLFILHILSFFILYILLNNLWFDPYFFWTTLLAFLTKEDKCYRLFWS